LGRKSGCGGAALATNYPTVGPGCHSLFHINFKFLPPAQRWEKKEVKKRETGMAVT